MTRGKSDQSASGGAAISDARARRILVVEDDAELREAMADVLRLAGHEVDVAGDGRAALERMRQVRPDLVVLDLMLPVVDGWEVLAEQRNSPALADVPVIVVSGNATAVVAAVHAELYMVKPIDAQTIVQAVADVLGSVDQRRDPARLAHEDRLAALGTLAAGIAHEVTNPLTYVFLELEKARSLVAAIPDPRVASDLGLAVARALDGAERIKGIVHDVSTFARADSGEKGLVDLAEVVETAVRLVRHRIESRARLSWEPKAAPPVLGSEGRLVQVFLNLLVNAVQAIPAGAGRAHDIGVSTGTDELGWAFAEVSDTGPGVPKHLATRIFEPFFTTKSGRGGTGLGLALCKDIVESHGGEIELFADEGGGTRFRVRLPPATGSALQEEMTRGAEDAID